MPQDSPSTPEASTDGAHVAGRLGGPRRRRGRHQRPGGGRARRARRLDPLRRCARRRRASARRCSPSPPTASSSAPPCAPTRASARRRPTSPSPPAWSATRSRSTSRATAGEWMLLAHQSPYAGRGRAYGRADVFHSRRPRRLVRPGQHDPRHRAPLVLSPRGAPLSTAQEPPMPDAVIVSTARTPIGTAFKGSLRRRRRPRRSAPPSWPRPSAGRASTPSAVDDVVLGESLYGGGDIARYAAIEAGLDARRPAWPTTATAPRAWPRCTTAAGVDPGRHGPGRDRRRRRSRRRPRPASTRRVPGTDDWDDWMSPSHRDTPDAPEHGHVDHRRLERRGRRPT